MPWTRPLSLRVRLVLLGVAAVALALAIGSVALYSTLSIAVNRTLDVGARTSADDVAVLVDRGPLPHPLPISGAQVVQVIDAGHRVVDGSLDADGLTPLLHPDELRAALAGRTVTVMGSRAGLSGPLRVVARPAGQGAHLVSVVVAVQVSDVLQSVRILRSALLVGYPVLLGLLALGAWLVIGRALRPVEQLRRGAARISGSGRAERLPVSRSADEIAALAITLNDMLDRLNTARTRQRDFVADAAHELRSPLASMLVQLEVSQRLGEDSPIHDDILADVRRLSSLTEDLLLLARADADTRGPGRTSTFDVQELLEELGNRTHRGTADVRIQPGPTVLLTADRDEIRRAVGNLLDNASRHARSIVGMSVELDRDVVVIDVIDDGPGIAPSDYERVFQRFTRLDGARDRDAGGSGLGLPIVRELIRRAGGTVTLGPADPAVAGAERSGLRVSIAVPTQQVAPPSGLGGPQPP